MCYCIRMVVIITAGNSLCVTGTVSVWLLLLQLAIAYVLLYPYYCYIWGYYSLLNVHRTYTHSVFILWRVTYGMIINKWAFVIYNHVFICKLGVWARTEAELHIVMIVEFAGGGGHGQGLCIDYSIMYIGTTDYKTGTQTIQRLHRLQRALSLSSLCSFLYQTLKVIL